jgi:hypothetical protein
MNVPDRRFHMPGKNSMSWLQYYFLRHDVRNSAWILAVFDMEDP